MSPAWVLVPTGCAGVLAVLVILMRVENRRDDRAADAPKAPRRVVAARSRAVETRARRHALVAARRRVRAIRQWAAREWDGLRNWAGPLETRTWARRAIARRIHGITIDVTGDTPLEPERARIEYRHEDRDLFGTPEDAGPPAEPTRKATGGEVRDAEVRATRPWSDDTGSFTAFVEEGA